MCQATRSATRLARKGLESRGHREWVALVTQTVDVLRRALVADYTLLGGGNADRIDPLPPHTRRGGNDDAFEGGFRLWEELVEPHDRKPAASLARRSMKYLAPSRPTTTARSRMRAPSTTTPLSRCRVRDRPGLSLILVTGRELADLFNTFPHAKLFDRIVAENGAVLYDPAEQTIQSLAPPAAPALVSALQRARIPLSVGHSIVATVEPPRPTCWPPSATSASSGT